MISIIGTVIQGKKRGKLLGFPTANVMISQDIRDGVYAGEVIHDGKSYQSAVFVGASETYGERDKKLEAFILDFDEDIYGKSITVYLHKLIRDSSTFVFESEAKLLQQIHQDVSDTRSFFASKE